MDSSFTERFNELTGDLSVPALANILGQTEEAARQLREGKTQTLDLQRAVRLCRVLGVSIYYLAGEVQPTNSHSAPMRMEEAPAATEEAPAATEQARAATEQARAATEQAPAVEVPDPAKFIEEAREVLAEPGLPYHRRDGRWILFAHEVASRHGQSADYGPALLRQLERSKFTWGAESRSRIRTVEEAEEVLTPHDIKAVNVALEKIGQRLHPSAAPADVYRRLDALETATNAVDPDRIEQLESEVDDLRVVATRVPDLDELLDAIIQLPLLPESLREQVRKARASGPMQNSISEAGRPG